MPEKSTRIEELVKNLLKGHGCERAHLVAYEGSVNQPLSTYDLYLQVSNWLALYMSFGKAVWKKWKMSHLSNTLLGSFHSK